MPPLSVEVDQTNIMGMTVNYIDHINGITRMELFFYAHQQKSRKNHPFIDLKIVATLKGKNWLPLGANSFL